MYSETINRTIKKSVMIDEKESIMTDFYFFSILSYVLDESGHD